MDGILFHSAVQDCSRELECKHSAKQIIDGVSPGAVFDADNPGHEFLHIGAKN